MLNSLITLKYLEVGSLIMLNINPHNGEIPGKECNIMSSDDDCLTLESNGNNKYK